MNSPMLETLITLVACAIALWLGARAGKRKLQRCLSGQREWRDIAGREAKRVDHFQQSNKRLLAENSSLVARLSSTECALLRTQEALHRVSTDPEALRRFRESKEAFMREIEGLRS